MLLVCGCCRGGGGAEFSERSSGQRDAVRVVHQAIHDRVAEGGVPDAFVPVLDGDLTGEQRGAPARAIFDHLQEIAPFPIADRREAPIVQNQEIGLAQLREQFAVRAVVARDDQLRQESRQAQIADGVAMAARTLTKRTGQPAFTRPGWPRDEQHPVLPDPVAGRESQELQFVEAALHAKVDILDRRRVAQSRQLQEPRESPILARELFARSR